MTPSVFSVAGSRRSRTLAATTRVIDSVRAVVSGYGIRPDELDHAIRMLRCTIHGYAQLQAANAFQWSNDPDESLAWTIRFIDFGLTAVGDANTQPTPSAGQAQNDPRRN